MKGFFVGHKGTNIEKVSKDSEELSLLARGDGTEIMTQKIQPGKIFYISPGETGELMEFFYILEGSVSCEQNGEDVVLKNGEYFYVHNIKESVYFKTNTEVTLIYISTQPVFHFLSNEIQELKKIVDKIREKDKYTHNHDVRLQDYAMKIGERLRLSKEHLENLLYASLFHDIGKISVPDEILNKPGRLTEEEFEYIKKHPSNGKKMVEETFLMDIGDIIEQHHERLDGSGYPYGFTEDQICIEAKIIAVVDSYDAMTSDRPYRKAMDSSYAVSELKSLVGKHYDKKIVDTFEDILKEQADI